MRTPNRLPVQSESRLVLPEEHQKPFGVAHMEFTLAGRPIDGGIDPPFRQRVEGRALCIIKAVDMIHPEIGGKVLFGGAQGAEILKMDQQEPCPLPGNGCG